MRGRSRALAAALTTALVCSLAAYGGTSAPAVTPAAAPAGRPAARAATHRPGPTRAITRAAAAQLPRGGTKIIGHYRVVAYYGAPGSGALGVLGRGSPTHAARSVIARSRHYARFGLPVQPAMELIATVAQSSPGRDGDYSAPIPRKQIERYLAVAHRFAMLLVLDLQPGRASFLSQAKALRTVLLDPSVGIGLDPEWKVRNGAPGGGRIGSSTAAGVNRVTDWLSTLVRRHHLPDKLEIVHEFTRSMLHHRTRIHLRPGVEVTFHADGFGSRRVKRSVFAGLHFPGHPFGTGFKLFLRQDTHLMTPAQVMALHPRPDVVTYQ